MPAKPRRPPYFSQEHGSWIVPGTKGVLALVDQDIADTLGQLSWQSHLSNGRIWYLSHGIWNAKALQMHREIMSASDGEEVDHREQYPTDLKLIDNRRTNLRICGRGENMRNQRKKRYGVHSRFKGVAKHAKSFGWIATIGRQNQKIYLGYYMNELDAALAYDKAARELHGEFAATNESLGLLPPGITCR